MKYTNLSQPITKGFKIEVGDLVLYETLIEDVDDANDYTTNVYYEIIQSVTKHKNYYEFDIKKVETEEPSKEERFEKIINVCTTDDFNNLIQKVEEIVEKQIKSLQSLIEQVKPNSEKQIKQYEKLKALLVNK